MKMMLCVAAAAMASNLLFAHANLQGEARPSSLDYRPLGEVPASGQAASPVAAPLAKPLKVHLERVKARLNSPATFYVGKVSVGQPPQELTVVFDTSSGHVLVPHKGCKSSACLEHIQYSPWKSTTSTDVNVDGGAVDKGHRFARHGLVRTGVSVDFTQADLGEGTAKSVVVRDNVCMEGDQGDACVDLEVVTAIQEQDVPFRAMPNDGIVGLGLESLAAGPLLSFMSRLMGESKNVLPQFGISFGPEGGDIYFGGQSPSLTSPLQWLPVDHPEGGYWQVDIKAVRVGGKVVDECRRGCHGVIDSGCTGPTLEFDLGATVVTLEAKYYSDESCKPSIGPLNLEEPAFVGVYAFGESVLRRYYVGFDWENKKVGFAPNPSASPSAVVV